MSINRILVIAIYNHPENYPPTLNAVEYLSGVYDKIFILHRNYFGYGWKFPENVKLVSYGKNINPRDIQKQNSILKLYYFLQFTWRLLLLFLQNQVQTFLIYDCMPLLSYRLCKPLIKNPKILWYHNHDVADLVHIKRFSLSWWAWQSEKWVFPQLKIFSLPSMDRKRYFAMEKLKGTFFFLPNFPSIALYRQSRFEKKNLCDNINIIYQGIIGPLHGFENIIKILSTAVADKKIYLHLKGFISEEYKTELINLSMSLKVESQLTFYPHTGYQDIINNSHLYHIGIGIYQNNDIAHSTSGTASNKIYEYAAAGMPVLIFDNPYFRSIFNKRKWVSFTDTSSDSLKQCIKNIVSEYDSLSSIAVYDFENELCFENNFRNVTDLLSSKN